MALEKTSGPATKNHDAGVDDPMAIYVWLLACIIVSIFVVLATNNFFAGLSAGIALFTVCVLLVFICELLSEILNEMKEK